MNPGHALRPQEVPVGKVKGSLKPISRPRRWTAVKADAPPHHLKTHRPWCRRLCDLTCSFLNERTPPSKLLAQ